jgi:hypothetical protein
VGHLQKDGISPGRGERNGRSTATGGRDCDAFSRERNTGGNVALRERVESQASFTWGNLLESHIRGSSGKLWASDRLLRK